MKASPLAAAAPLREGREGKESPRPPQPSHPTHPLPSSGASDFQLALPEGHRRVQKYHSSILDVCVCVCVCWRRRSGDKGSR